MAVEGWWMGFESIDQSGQNHKLNVIQKWAFHVFGWRGLADGVWVHWPVWLIIRSWTKSKIEHFIFLVGEGWQMGFKFINQPGRSSEVYVIQKQAFHFFWLERDGGWGSSPLTSTANHQKLSVIHKRSISFFWLQRGGEWGLSPSTSPADHQKWT